MAAPPSVADVAGALLAAYAARHGGAGPPRDAAIVWPLAQAMSEGSMSGYFAGTNNLGAMHATSGFARAHGGEPGYGMVAFLDHGADGAAYVARMAVYPTLATGAGAFLDLVERMVDLTSVESATDYATALYAHGWYEGTAPGATPIGARAGLLASGQWTLGDRQNIARYAAGIERNAAMASAGLAAARAGQVTDPNAPSSGDFAPLGDRLTPSPAYAPHTIAHARELLGAAAEHPPAGAIALSDALSTPEGDGVWRFGTDASGAEPAPRSSFSWAPLWWGLAIAGAIVAGGALGRHAAAAAS